MSKPYETLLFLDFESRWSSKPTAWSEAPFTLSKMTTEAYIRSPHFKAFGMCIHEYGTDKATQWYSYDELPRILSCYDWKKTAIGAQNSMFDAGILSFIYDVHPCFIFDTLSMARALRGAEGGNSLMKLAEDYGLPPKGRAVHSTDGLWELTPQIEKELAEYCMHDVYLCEQIFSKLVLRIAPDGTTAGPYPTKELRLIDMTVKMFTEPQFVLDVPMLEQALLEDNTKLANALTRAGVDAGVLGSNEQFADVLRSMGVEPPTKPSPANKDKQIYAFAKTDAMFQAMLNGDDEDAALVCEARLKVKSTQERTRSQRFIDIAGRGALPVPLHYAAAKTFRWGGTQQLNLQNMKRGSALRKSIMAPKGYQVVVGDLSQIECVCDNTQILTRNRGYVRITDVRLSDLLWDGVDWVRHEGIVFKGFKEVISYGGITGTANHIVYTEDGRAISLGEAADEVAELAVGEREGEAVWYVACVGQTNTTNKTCNAVVPVPALRGVAVGRAPGPAQGEVNSMPALPHGKQVLRKAARRGTEGSESALQQDNVLYERAVREPGTQGVQTAWNTEQVQELRRVRALHLGEFSATELRGGGDRPRRQRWALRAGEHSAVNTREECTEQALQLADSIQGGDYECAEVLEGGPPEMSHNNGGLLPEEGGEGGRDIRAVYDIINAGPRHRFTANGVIISNCRTMAWLSGNGEMLDIFKTGADPYATFGATMFGVPGLNKTEHPLLRQSAKSCSLGAMYMLSWGAMAAQMLTGFLGAPPQRYTKHDAKQLGVTYESVQKFLGWKDNLIRMAEIPHTCTDEELLIHCLAAKAIIDKYRAASQPVVDYWAMLGERIRSSLIAGEVYDHKGVLQFRKGEIELVSGMVMQYRDIKSEKDEKGRTQYTYQDGKSRKRLHQGVLANQTCQATARVLMGDGMLRVAKRYAPKMTVHDEFGILVADEDVAEVKPWFKQMMVQVPKWMPGIPLDAEVGAHRRYGLAK